ncbi:hypothetical protein [Paenibacillus sp. BK720]|uniref:hypothetical protein n=1 Tax=Paenibacillus sp. BK720 TaxID=2587092 RepID=UPI0014248132|nr:hypothetical protein [Paenibacillus sp. BK720]NIK67951.1 hypothetical protein [Paenibacillus sp. BK720]
MGIWQQFKDDYKKKVNEGLMKTIKLDYIGGMPDVKGKEIVIAQHPDTKYTTVNKKEGQLLGIDWQESGKRSAGKAAAGAIIGSLAGPIGTVAGAAIGGRRKDSSTAILSVEVDGQQYSVYVRCSEDEFKTISNFM